MRISDWSSDVCSSNLRRRDIRKLSISSVVRYSPLDLPTGIPVLDAMFEPRHDPFRRLPVRELPRKLRLAMRVAGCATQKEMHARLKAVNPGTGYEPSREIGRAHV